MCWHHSLILRHATENSHLYKWVFNTFSTYHVFSLISLSLHLIKCYWSFSYHWHLFFTSTIEVKTQTRFMVLFASGSLTHLGEISKCLAWHLPEVFAYYPPLIINSLHLYRNHMMTKFAFFSNRAERWKRDLASLWGTLDICPCLDHLELPCHSPVELSSLSSFKVWGNTKEPHHDIAYLLVCMGSTNEDRPQAYP